MSRDEAVAACERPRSASSPPHAPEPIGPYSQAMLSGERALLQRPDRARPADRRVDIAATSRRKPSASSKISARCLAAAGCTFADVVKTTIFLVDMNDFATVNERYERCFGASRPARSTVAAAGLPKGARIEIDCLAVKRR